MKNIAATILCIAISFNLSAQQAGDLDITFDGDGKVQFNNAGYNPAAGLVIQSDQKIVRGGTGPNTTLGTCVKLVRYLPDGSLDESFGVGGVAEGNLTLGASTWAQNNTLEQQPDGKLIFTSSRVANSSLGLFVSRFNSDGSVDTDFGDNGTAMYQVFNSGDDYCHSMMLQPDGKIIVVGQGQPFSGVSYQMAAIRLMPNGDLDESFGDEGVFTYDHGSGDDRIMDVALQSDGKIILTGNATQQGYGSMIVMRLTEDGTLDETFATEGIFEYSSTSNVGYEYANAVCIGANDEIHITGQTYEVANGRSDLPVMKLTPDGEFDTSFGDEGSLVLHLGDDWDFGEDILLDEEGRILVCCTHYTHDYFEGLILRFLPDGTLDGSFGDEGSASVGGDYIRAENIRLQADGKIVMGAWDRILETNSSYYQTIRVLADGTSNVETNTTNQSVLYPNPASDNLMIQTNSNSPISAELFNAQGMLLEKFQNQRQVPISHLPGGVYFLTIESATDKRTLRFVKE